MPSNSISMLSCILVTPCFLNFLDKSWTINWEFNSNARKLTNAIKLFKNCTGLNPMNLWSFSCNFTTFWLHWSIIWDIFSGIRELGYYTPKQWSKFTQELGTIHPRIGHNLPKNWVKFAQTFLEGALFTHYSWSNLAQRIILPNWATIAQPKFSKFGRHILPKMWCSHILKSKHSQRLPFELPSNGTYLGSYWETDATYYLQFCVKCICFRVWAKYAHQTL